MINTKLILIIVAAVTVIVAGYFTLRTPVTPPGTPAPITAAPILSAVPSPQYLHDHPSELAEAKTKCNGETLPPEPYCTNVQKAEELVEVDEYRKAEGEGAKPK
jgi:hypothetical protein